MAPMFRCSMKRGVFFVAEQYAQAIPLLEQILGKDPHISTRSSAWPPRIHPRHERCLAAYRKAEVIAPNSADVRTYLALHYARTAEWQTAVPMWSESCRDSDKVRRWMRWPWCRERQASRRCRPPGRRSTRSAPPPRGAHSPRRDGDGPRTDHSGDRVVREGTRGRGAAFKHDTELGVLYLASQRFEEARTALDRVQPGDPA